MKILYIAAIVAAALTVGEASAQQQQQQQQTPVPTKQQETPAPTQQQQQQQQQTSQPPKTPAPTTAAPTTAPPKSPAPTTTAPPAKTPAPTTAQPPATTQPPKTPAPTTKAPVTPAPTTLAPKPTNGTVVPKPTPASSTPAPSPPKYDPTAKCWWVSVERDATYCIPGPICVGSGDKPAGSNCPKKGDIAVDACRKYLKSYVEADKCVLPVDAACQKIHTGAWGCVLPGAPGPTPASTVPKPANNTAGNHTKNDIQFPKQTKQVTLSSAGKTGGSSFAVVGAVAAMAAVGCAVAGTMIYKKKQATAEQESSLQVDTIMTP